MNGRSFLRHALAWVLLLCMLIGLMPVNVFATEGEGEAKAATKAATSYVAQIDALPTPYNVAISPTTNKYTEVFVNNGLGYYYIVNKDSSTAGHLLSTSEQYYDQYIPSTDVTIKGNALTNPDPNNAIRIAATAEYRGLFYPYKGNTLTFSRVSGDTRSDDFLYTGRGLFDSNKMGGRVSNGLWVFPIFSTGAVGDDNDAWFTLTYDATEDAFAFVYHGKDHMSFLSTQTMQLYRVYTQGIELYKAMKAVRGYADGNADGRYPDDLYVTFSNYLKSCIDAYTANNTATEDEEGLKTTLDDMADQLFVYANKLSANVTDLDSYIDIPIEILDFRADGMLMEWDRATHPLWNFRSQPNQTGASQDFVKFPPGENPTVYTGLTESKLIGGQMIYTEKVVGYVAGLLSKKYATDWSTNTKIPGYNNISYEKMSDLTEMGTFAKTIGKTDTEKNGGYLDWSEVTSYYDMAYYILNNLWRPVESDDYMDTVKKVGYNMVVPERKRMRLFKDKETGYYTIDAANRLIYDGYHIFNASEKYPNDAVYGDAFFRPIDNLGFETAENAALLGGDTDQGEYLTKYQHESGDMNFHFSVHAKGSFVYYRDQNLYFQFIGDDDVYFFIDGEIAMDLGGSHGALGDELFLNDIAEEFGLVDGNVYSFDMFYIERHATASNLKFSTNIKIVETETMTTKGMYLESSKGVSKVDSTTGMGEALADNSLLRTGDVVAYSFNIANSRNIPVYNLSFVDNTMGTSLAYNAVYLCNTNLTGGLNTAIGDIKVYYRTMDSNGNINSATPVNKTYSQITSMINTANSNQTSLAAGAYVVSPGYVSNLKELLKLGIPANCQIMIYGFKRQAQESVPSYENTLSSVCYYNLEGTGQTTSGVEEIPIKGTASRIYKVTAEPPTSQKQEIVLDYGKAVEIPTDIIGQNIHTDTLTTVTGFAGIVLSGSHEQVLTYISPSNLKCSSVGQTYAGVQGTFTRTDTGLDYQPTEFMETIETVYLVYNISATNSDYKYVLVEMNLLPATFVYYESDFATNVFSTISGADLFDHSDCFYVDFNNSEWDEARYANTNYGGKNYDTGNWNLRSYTMSSLKYDSTLGVLSATRPIDKDQTLTLHYFRVLNLDYDPTNAEVLVARVKIEGMQRVSGAKIKIYASFFNKNNESTIKTYTIYQDSDDLVSGEFVDIVIPVSDLGSYGKLVREIRLNIDNIQLADPNVAGNISLDYMYVGPEENAPAKDHLFFDFTNTEADRNRYSTHNYKGQNFDTEAKWVATWLSSGVYSSVQIDQNKGTLTTTADKGSCYVETALKPGYYKREVLSYDPSDAEILKLRFKLSNTTATAPKIQLGYGIVGDPGTVGSDGSAKHESTMQTFEYTEGMYTTVTVPLSNTFRNAGAIAYIRLQFLDVSVGTEVTIDYIYLGPEDDAPAGDHLYFDFTNTPADKARYANDPAYGGYNFDDDACWTGKWDANGNHADTIVDNVAGTITSSYSGSSEVYFYTTYNGKYSTKTLKFNPKTAEVWEVRFKLNAALSGSANVRLNYAADGSADILYTENKPTFTDTKANEYITITQPLTATFKGKSQIVSLRLAFNGIPAGTEITVDYIFVGAEADLEKVRATNNTNWQTVNDFTSTTDDYQDQEFIAISREETSSQLETIGAGPKILNEYYGIRNGLSNYNNNIPLSFSHRGSFRTSSENSYLAVLESLKQGMDGVEIDLMITSDKVVVLSHDTTLSRTTGDNVTIANVTWNSIRDYPLEVGNGTGDAKDYTLTADEAEFLNSTLDNYVKHYGEAASSGGKHYTARLDDILEMVKKKAPNAILTFDKVNSNQDIFVYSFKAAYDAGMLKNVFFKLSQNATTLKTWASAAATACGISQAEVLSSMQMLWVIGIPTASSVNSIKTYRNNGINVVAVEGSWTSPLTEAQEDVIINTFMPYCRENNIDFWPTVIGPRWAGQLDDDETTWLYYLEYLGVDGLMTDRPEEFGAFMHYYNGASRASSELIQAEHFQSYNLHSGKFYMNEAADVNNNKLVNEMYNGDYLEYRNITFTGSENTLYVTAKGINGGGSLKFYVDNMNEESCFATISFGTGEYCVTRTATMDRTVSKGTHKIYVQVLGNDKMALLSLDSYTFQKQSDDHYLFFDFNNTPEDQNRYKKAIYGSNYNFDIKNYWATYSSDNSSDSVNKTNFTVENGVAKVKVGDDFEGENTYCGPKFMTTKTYGVFPYRGQGANAPLRYVPSENDYLVVRFKLDNVIAGSDYTPMLFMEYHWNDASGADNIKYEDLKADYNLVTGQWQTVAVPVSATFKNAKEITSLGLRFTGILSSGAAGTGTVTIDYIYVGPLQQADHLLIDFEENLGTYEDSVYGGVNYDLSSKWTYSGTNRNSAPTVADGEISTTTTGASTASYYHIKMTTANLTYVPGDDDYCEIRFKVSNATGDGSGNDPEVLLYFSPDLYDTKGTGGNNSNKTTIPISTLADGKYHTIRFPLNQTYYRDAGIIRSIALMFNKFSNSAIMTFTVDYVYVGPLSNAPSDPNNSLFFDFTNTAADRERYSSYTYGGYNFDMPGEGYWATNATAQNESTNEKNYVIDNEAGTATVAVGDTSEGENLYGPKFQTTNTYGKYPWNNADRHACAPLHYKPTGKEYIQVRFKIEDCETVGELKFQMDYHFNPISGSNYMKYAGLNKAFTYTEGEWVTVTHSLSGISTFQNADEILSVGLRFVGIRSKDPDNLGHVVIDYIYVGPEEGLPSMDRDTYGYDSSYIDDSLLSNGSSMFVQGKGIPNIVKNSDGSPKYIDYAGAGAYTELSFTFTGAGFDLISRTGVNQGLIRAVIFDRGGNIVKNVSVNNKGETELYQIPVLSVEKLTHGTYTVKIFVDEAFDYGNNGNVDVFGGAMDRGGEFYFDAIRIYNPINTQSSDAVSTHAYEVYQKHGEADPTITEVRNILIDANSFNSSVSAINGVVYLDATALPGTNFDTAGGKLSAAIAEYKAIGPNNEVYLQPGKAIAFKLEMDGPVPASIDIGAKSANGDPVTMSVGISKNVPTALSTNFSQKIQTSTAQYYPLEVLPSKLKTTTTNGVDTHSVYITVCHTGTTGILSLTDIKYAYDSPNPEEPAARMRVRFVVDEQMVALYSSSCDHAWDQGQITTAPTCTADGVKTFTCTLCGLTYTESIAALEHSYTNGVCVCGQTEEQTPLLEASWKLNHTLNLASDISVNLVVPKTLLADYDMGTVYVLAEVDTYAGNVKTGTDTVKLQPVEQGNYYYFTLTGLTAVKMNDRIRSVLYGTKDSQLYYSATDDYSIATYAYAQLNKTGIAENLKTLCADLLRYGAEAQSYKGYRTNSLADQAMTDSQRAYLSDIEAVTFGNHNAVREDLAAPAVTWAGKALVLDSRVTVRFVINAAGYKGSAEDLELRIRYRDLKGTEQTATLTEAIPYGNGGNAYAFDFAGLNAAELRAVLEATVYAGDVQVSDTLTYSADTYGNNKTGALLDLCKALFAYADSAKAFFAE